MLSISLAIAKAHVLSLPLISAHAISPVHLSTNIPNLIELRADLDHRVADQTRVQTESPLDSVLCLCA